MSDTTLKPKADEMGRVTVKAKVENLHDVLNARAGIVPEEQIRQVIIDNALVDTGCVGLALPHSVIADLGSSLVRTRTFRTTSGPREASQYDAVRLTIQDRSCTADVYGVPDDCPALIGQVPLELMDFVVDPRRRELIGNPEHDGEWVIEMY